VEAFTALLKHAFDKIHRTIAGRLGAHARAAPGQALAGEDAGFVAVGDALVLAEHVADFALADANVAGRNVGIFPEMPAQFGHEGLTKAHDLPVRTSFRVEIGASLAA